MPTDIEEQIHNYFRWLDEHTGATLQRPTDKIEDSPPMVEEFGAALIDIREKAESRSRRTWILGAVAAIAIVAAGIGVLGNRSRDAGVAVGQLPVTSASWYEVDPAGAFASLGEGTIVDGFGGVPLACRRFDSSAERCTELVGEESVNYRLAGNETLTVRTEHGPDESTEWQFLRNLGTSIEISGHSGFADGDSSSGIIGFEPSPGVRVIVFGGSTQTVETVAQIAASLKLTGGDVVAPIVFGESTPTLAEFPAESVAARYYAGYVDLTASPPCVGAFGMPWNNTPVCVRVPDDRITVTVASPSPAGTILIAALPAATDHAAVVMQDGATVPLGIAIVPEFDPKLVFADLDGGIPVQLVAYDAAGTSIADTAITSTGGAPLGFIPIDGATIGDAPPVDTYYTTVESMPAWPTTASSQPYTNNAGYGMALCDSSSWTKFAALQSNGRFEHLYQGTLCAFTTLRQPRVSTAASCATMSPGTTYARCQRLSGTTAVATPSESQHATVAPDQKASHAALLPATPGDAPQIFNNRISAAGPEPAGYGDPTVLVTLSTGAATGETCFQIDFHDYTSKGCLDTRLLTTGLAYGAFQDGDGPVEIVGIVPDDVATIEIAGTIIPVTNNVWHYTGHAGDNLTFRVVSANGVLTAAVT